MKRTITVAIAGMIALAIAGCGSTSSPSKSAQTPGGGSFTSGKQDTTSPITVWVDSTRLPMIQAFQKAHPDVKVTTVTYSADAGGAGDLQTKVELFNRSGSGWPDVAFSTTQSDASWVFSGSTPFAAPINQGLIDKSVLDQFAPGSLTPCTAGTQIFCVRNDIAQTMLWYNKSLMTQFGYTVPTTWEQYEALGQKVATEHPGYLVGSADLTANAYLWPSQCPAAQSLGADKIKVDFTDPKCTRMINLEDTLLKAGSFAKTSVFDASFIKKSAAKVLMMPGPSWYGQYLFADAFKTPKGQVAAAAPLKWQADSQAYAGNYGGGLWFISQHSKNLTAAAQLVQWVTTDNSVQGIAPSYPAYAPAAKAWLTNPQNTSYFANDVGPVFEQAAAEVWTGWTDATPWAAQDVFNSAVLPGVADGKSIGSQLGGWRTAIVNKAKSAGYDVS